MACEHSLTWRTAKDASCLATAPRNGNTFAAFRDLAAEVAGTFGGTYGVLDGELVRLDDHGLFVIVSLSVLASPKKVAHRLGLHLKCGA
jgi:hypothetical protein